MPKLRNKSLNKVPTPWMHSMFCFTVMQVYSCWNFTCQSGLVWEGVPKQVWTMKVFPAQLAYSFPTLGIYQRAKDTQLLVNAMPGWSMQITPGHQTERFETSPCLRGKRCAEFIGRFSWRQFLFAVFLTSLFSEAFKSFAQTCLGTNARPLVLFKCASGCLAPAKGCAMFGVNDWHQRC